MPIHFKVDARADRYPGIHFLSERRRQIVCAFYIPT